MLLCSLSSVICQDTVTEVSVSKWMFMNRIGFCSKKWIFFQFLHKVPPSQLTVHIIAHHRKIRSHLDVYKHLQNWVPRHLYWIQHVGREILTEPSLKVEEFANNIISPKVPIDELDLLVIARMYHTHFGVVLKDRVWYTTDDNSSKCSKFLLVYQGGVSFSDTCTANWNLPSPPAMILVLDEDTPPQQSPVNLVTSPKPCETTASSVLMPLHMCNKNELEGDQKMDSDAQNMDFDDQKEDCQKADSQNKKFDSEDKMDYGDRKEDSQKADLNNDKMDCDAENMDFEDRKEDSQNGKMDSEDKMDYDDHKEDCDKADKVDSNMSQSQKEEFKEHKSEKRQSRPQKRPQTSSRCLRSSPSASNKCIKISQTSVTSQKVGLCPVDLDDFFRERRSHIPSGRDKKKCNKWKMTRKPRKKDRKKKHKAKANAKHEEQRKQK